ncbi:His-Xaa-Ser system protein HxsD [Vreelandella malpeensis]|uniref:His-Xaa-Ser system protein HxsD n=1 Tax=Vreelandella malpeensis TaxID=1172368 RepID=A0ABS8DSK0_9GAMM|nr:His-Xaa-Ser system protein HxsD [Halomonas malpeensis]MCB8889238.1 His-Xaa-Ser system protein HxsD [Halomonas malpeensis]
MLWSSTVAIDTTIYPLQVAQKASYALANTLSILIQTNDTGLNLLVTPADPAAAPSEAAARTLVIRTLNDFALREQVHKETSGIRELLARTALKESLA